MVQHFVGSSRYRSMGSIQQRCWRRLAAAVQGFLISGLISKPAAPRAGDVPVLVPLHDHQLSVDPHLLPVIDHCFLKLQIPTAVARAGIDKNLVVGIVTRLLKELSGSLRFIRIGGRVPGGYAYTALRRDIAPAGESIQQGIS